VKEGAMNYDDWVKGVPETITGDVLWTVKAYRFALFAADLCWSDVTKLMQDRRTFELSNQLYDAIGSIGANIAEGYSRSTGKDRARFFEYALGAARESRDWYYKGRHVLGEVVVNHWLEFLTQIVRMLITTVPQQRASGSIRESGPAYEISLDSLLSNVPLS
jgi:four helix bundle protein